MNDLKDWLSVGFKKKAFLIQVLLLGAITFVSYGFQISHIGFHYDDIGSEFYRYFYGPEGMQAGIAYSRPLYARLYGIVPDIIGYSAVKWQIFILLEWWCCSILFFIFLRKLHPSLQNMALWASLLFVVYPAFSQVHIALTYGMGALLTLAMLASMIFMEYYVLARKFKFLYLLISLMFMLNLFMSEYFFGMEVCRIFFIAVLVSRSTSVSKIISRQNLKKTFLYFLPYGIVILVYLYWRLFLFHASYPGTNQALMLTHLKINFITRIFSRIECLASDVLIIGFFAWVHSFGAWFYENTSGTVFFVWAVFFMASALIYLVSGRFLNTKIKENTITGDQKQAARFFILLSLIIMIFSQSIVSGSPLELGTIADRYAIPGIFGSCLFVASVIYVMAGTHKMSGILLTLIVAGGAAYQYKCGKTLEKEHNYQKDFFYQLQWRAPYIERGTYLTADQLPDANPYDVGYTMAAVGMGMYGVSPKIDSPQYCWISDIEGPPWINSNGPYAKEQLISMDLGLLKFTGNANKSIALWKPVKGCLRVIDSTNKDLVDLSPSRRLDAAMSNTALIRETGPKPAKNGFLNLLFSRPDTNCWCYYFEKAELARQKGNWPETYTLLKTALNKKLLPENDMEWLVYLEASLHIKNYEAATETLTACANNPLVKAYAYNLVLKMKSNANPADQAKLAELIKRL